MPEDLPVIPPWPGRGKPRLRSAFMEAVAAAAERAAWGAVIDALRVVPPAEMPQPLVHTFIAAALDDGRPASLSAAVAAAAEADLFPRGRAVIALRLARSCRPAEAWTVLHSDPAAARDPQAFPAVDQLLGTIAQEPRASVELRAAARALKRRFTNGADIGAQPAPYRYAAGPLDPQPGGNGAARLVTAPGLSRPVADAYRHAIQSFETALAGREQPGVRELRDVFVNRLGQVWLADGRVVLSHSQPLPDASRAAMAVAPWVAEGVHALESHHNIYHWLADRLPALAWRFEPAAADPPILIRDDAPGYVTDSLRFAGGESLGIVRAGDALRVERLLLGAIGATTIAPLGAHRRLLEGLRAAVDAAPAPPGGTARRLYISRRDSTKRRLGNEEAVEAAFAARGFRIATFTGTPYAAQARLVRDADVVAGPHGAGFAHLLLARPGTKVFEIVPGMVNAAPQTTCMARLSRLIGLRHVIWLEARNPVNLRWSANLDAMLPALDDLLAEGR